MPKNITVTIQEDYNDLLFKNHRLINIIFIQVKNSLSNSLFNYYSIYWINGLGIEFFRWNDLVRSFQVFYHVITCNKIFMYKKSAV